MEKSSIDSIAFLDLTLPTLAENLAFDEALLLAAESDAAGEVLRFWEWPHLAVVLGAGGRLSEDVNEAACQADGVEIARRSSGGGTVLLGPGCLLFSLVLSYERSPLLREIGSSYRYILEKTGAALGGVHAGISDLAIDGRKFSGNAQQRKRRFVLHHGTILYDFDIARIRHYLHPPAKQPVYREGRDHDDFLMNLPLPPEQIRATIRSAWTGFSGHASQMALSRSVASEWDFSATVEDLVKKKYAESEWIRRR